MGSSMAPALLLKWGWEGGDLFLEVSILCTQSPKKQIQHHSEETSACPELIGVLIRVSHPLEDLVQWSLGTQVLLGYQHYLDCYTKYSLIMFIPGNIWKFPPHAFKIKQLENWTEWGIHFTQPPGRLVQLPEPRRLKRNGVDLVFQEAPSDLAVDRSPLRRHPVWKRGGASIPLSSPY